MDSPHLYPSIDFPSQAEKYDTLKVETCSPIPLLEEGNHHLSLPIQRHHPHSVAEGCPPWQFTTSRALGNSGLISFTLGVHPPRSWLTASVTSPPVKGESASSSPHSASTTKECQRDWRDAQVFLQSFDYVLEVEVSRVPFLLYTVWIGSSFPFPELVPNWSFCLELHSGIT